MALTDVYGNRFQTISLIVLTSNGVPLFNITQMNDTCCFEEDVEHAFRPKPVASYYGSLTFTFTNPTSVSRLVSNLSQIKPRLIPSNNITYSRWTVSIRAKFSLQASTLSLRFWSVNSWGIQRDASFLF